MISAKFAYDYMREFGTLPANFDEPTDPVSLMSQAFKLPPAEAVAFFESKGYKITWDWRSMSSEFHKKAFTVAKVMQADLLQYFRDGIDSAIKNGDTFETFKKNVTPRLEESGWVGKKEVTNPDTGVKTKVDISAPSKLKTIFNTNLQSSYMTGRYEQMKETTSSHPYGLYWNLNPKSEICKAVKGKVVRIDDPNVRIPPMHYNCKTTIDPISEREARRSGYIVTDASRLYKSGGGVQESFDSHPDKPWKPDKTYDDDIQSMLNKSIKP